MKATRYFAGKAEAARFAKANNGTTSELDAWNPLRDFGYRWQVDYNPQPEA